MGLVLGISLGLPSPAHPSEAIEPAGPVLERATLLSLGVRLPYSGDRNQNARVGLSYRIAGRRAWRAALPLRRVDRARGGGHLEERPRPVEGGHLEKRPLPVEFAGSVLGLRPRTRYELRLRVVDPDGRRRLLRLRARTRAVPSSSPQHPRLVRIRAAEGLRAALASARPGDILQLGPGRYEGPFELVAHGRARDPIVIRGTGSSQTTLDGGGCRTCPVLDVRGSYVHVERLGLTGALRGVRLSGAGHHNVLRDLAVTDTEWGIDAAAPQTDLYLCDNVLRGRLRWPLVYADDNGANSGAAGISASGPGAVICRNEVAGFGDSIRLGRGDRAVDIYGNDVRWSYDNAVELDGGHGNLRVFENRILNSYDALSFQAVVGGPAIVYRNVVLNVASEQLKLKSEPLREPSGVLVYNNTFLSSHAALLLQSQATVHHTELANNLFVGGPLGASAWSPWTAYFSARLDRVAFDHNGYFPAGRFQFGDARFDNLAAARRAGFERHGRTVGRDVFATLSPPASYRPLLAPARPALRRSSAAIDAGRVLPGITDRFSGRGPDLGALELGAPRCRYGPSARGRDSVVPCATAGTRARSGRDAPRTGDPAEAFK